MCETSAESQREWAVRVFRAFCQLSWLGPAVISRGGQWRPVLPLPYVPSIPAWRPDRGRRESELSPSRTGGALALPPARPNRVGATRRVLALVLLACAALLSSCQGQTGSSGASAADTTYYLSPAGNNSAAGTSPATAWQTLARVDSARLRPGDRVLLRGGDRFVGELIFAKTDAGNAADPVVVGSYGSGRATVASDSNAGIVIYDTAGIDVENLVVAGQSSPRPTGIGINLYSGLPDNRKLTSVRIDNVDVSGFVYGIGIGGGKGTTGFRDVWVLNSTLHGNLDDGLISYAPAFNSAHPGYAHEDIYISHVHAYRNQGDAEDAGTNTGNGIVLGNVRHASISWSTASDNGGKGAASEGPVGIWAYDSTDVAIEHNLSYGNRTSNLSDGDGFGLDENTSDSYLQYNVSYDNAGAGYLLYSAQADSVQKGNIVRFNISSGDGQTSNYYGGITLIGQISDTAVYQNTVVMRARAGTTNPALRLVGSASRITVRNNIFVTRRGGPIVAANAWLRTTQALLQGNDYDTAAGTWAVTWGNATYQTLAGWRSASGQERLHGRATGFAVDPELNGPALGLHATTADDGQIGVGFTLQPTSPLLRAGLGLLVLFGTRTGGVTLSGTRSSGSDPNVGAE